MKDRNRRGFVAGRNLAVQRLIGFALSSVLAGSSVASAQTWEPAPTFPGSGGASTAILRSDGAVMVQEAGPGGGGNDTGNWYLLVPNEFGEYSAGSWLEMNPLGFNYAPHFYASAVLTTGEIFIAGGEYNNGNNVHTDFAGLYGASQSSIFKEIPHVPTWWWPKIGDGASVVLPNGQLMLGNCCSWTQGLLDPETLTWTLTGGKKKGKLDSNSEEGWTLLPNGKVLTVDTNNIDSQSRIHYTSELYEYQAGTWSPTGSLPPHVPLAYQCLGPGFVDEVGPAALRPDGTVFGTGANGLTAIYHYQTGKWTPGPIFPPNSAGQGQDGVCDGPAVVMPNGRVLVMTSNIDPANIPPADFYEFDGTNINPVPGPPNASNDVSFFGRFLVLPTGNILFTDGSQDVEIYEPADTSYSDNWRPTITSVSSHGTRGDEYVIKGTQFTGLTQGAYYGDDAQSATNFPLVRLTVDGGTRKGEVFLRSHVQLTLWCGYRYKDCGMQFPCADRRADRLRHVGSGRKRDSIQIRGRHG